MTAFGAVLDDSGLGRASSEDITVFDSSGLATQGLMAAQAVLDALEKHGSEGCCDERCRWSVDKS